MSVYLDHAATTPVRPEVLDRYVAALRDVGNPSSIHGHGRSARDLVETGREEIAAALGADPAEVLLTAGGTEAVNLGIKGLFWARRSADPRRTRVLVPEGEHAATEESVVWLGRHEGARIEHLPLDATGRLRRDALEASIAAHADEIALITLLWANNEVGTLQPVSAVAALAAEHGIPVHVDAIAAVGQVPVEVAATGVAALSVAGHKVAAPVSTGALVLGRAWSVEPLLHGGEQQRGRSGTEDAAGAAALGLAVRLAVEEQPALATRIGALRDRLVGGLLRIPGVVLRGDPDPAGRLPGNAHVTVEGADGDGLLYLLDAAGVSVSTGSACRAGVAEASSVLLAMGLDERTARGALRITLGRDSTDADVDALLGALPDAIDRSRAARAAHRTIRVEAGRVDAGRVDADRLD